MELAAREDDAASQAEIDALLTEYVMEADALDAEIDAMQAQFEADKARVKADFEAHKDELQSKIIDYNAELAEKRNIAADKLETFEGELSAGATKIKDAVCKLFS